MIEHYLSEKNITTKRPPQFTAKGGSFHVNPSTQKVRFLSDRLLSPKRRNNKFQIKKTNQPSQKYSSILNQIMINSEDWLKSYGADLPNEWSINKTIEILQFLNKNGISPDNISTIVEEGFCLEWKNQLRTFYLEIYNEMEVGFLAKDYETKKILGNKDGLNNLEILQEIQNFLFKTM